MARFTRREILTMFLGAPFAFAACRKSSAPKKLPVGEIVGANVELGHKLREARNFEVPEKNWQNIKVAIIGGGIAGLSAGWRLKKKGFNDFVILELEKEAGGTSRSGSGKPVDFPWGAHYLPVPFHENNDLIELLDEMSLTDGKKENGEILIKEQFLCREPEERIFYKGRWYHGLYLHVGESEEDIRQLALFQSLIDRWIDWRDSEGRRAFVVPSSLCSDDPEVTSLDKISFAEWLRQNELTSERLKWYCDYACRDDYGLKLDQTSAWAGLFYFCSRVRNSGDESQPFITFPEGNGRFVNHFSTILTNNIKSDHAVLSIVPSDRNLEVICSVNGELHGFRCEKGIYASPIFTAPYIIQGFRDSPPFAAEKFFSNSWFVANLHLKDRPNHGFSSNYPLSWDNVLYESPSLGYINSTHQKGIDHGPTILTYYYPMCHEEAGRTKLLNYTWEDLADVCLSDISRSHPDIYDLCERLDIMRWGHAMISPTPGFIWGGECQKAIKPYKNLHFAHTDLSGMALFEEAFHHGLRSADGVLS